MSTAHEQQAARLDAQDPLRRFRERFLIPAGPDGKPRVYLCGNSLGLQPRRARELIHEELDAWATRAVAAHHEGSRPWMPYHEFFRGPLSRLVGAKEREVVAMNSLTVNLHLLMISFYRPTKDRGAILIEEGAFPSDVYAVQSQIALHGLDPSRELLRLRPRQGEHTLRGEDIEAFLREHGRKIALVMLGGVNYRTGQLFDIARITRAAHAQGCVAGWDLAHAAGNAPLKLHEWAPDFAAWCSYKYLNAGPGAVAGAFVHERHDRASLPRLSGWWGSEPSTRFTMPDTFSPASGADAWQLSNPPVLALAPLLASLELFDEAGMEALRAKSLALTGFMESLLDELAPWASIITPRDANQRGAQLSLLVPGRARELEEQLAERGVITDRRGDDIIRAAPAPLYVSFADVLAFARTLASLKP